MPAQLSQAGTARIVLILALGLGCSAQAAAKGFKGALPGKTTRAQVIDKFGDPSREITKGGKLSDGLAYEGEEAISGSLVTNFFFDKHGILFRIDVYPARELTRAQVIRVYGPGFRAGATGQGDKYIQYPADGLIVFFEKDADRARVFLFSEPGQDG